jgi:competence protein ComEA
MADGARIRRAMLVGALGALIVAAIYVLLRQKHTPDLLVQSDEGWQPDVRVSVAGEVVSPGTYTLRGDARLSDLIAAAGGYTDKAERNALNPAARLGDGQQYVIPTQSSRTAAQTATAPRATTIPAASATPASATATTVSPPSATTSAPDTTIAGTTTRATATTAAKININTATKEELESLPAIGPAIAQRIIEDRNAHGPYQQIEDLARVRGISARTVEQLRDRITVGP